MSALSARSKVALAVSAAVGALALAAPAAFADNLYVCQSCTAAPNAPAIITDGSQFTMGISGSATLENPLLVIVGVYEGSSSAPPTLSFGSTASEPLATVGIYGLQTNEAVFDSTSVSLATDTHGKTDSPVTAYNVLGLDDQGGSEKFASWVGVDTTGNDGTALNMNAPGWFELFAFEVPTALSGHNDTFDISGAANGSFIIGFSCDSTKEGPVVGGPCAPGGDGNTPMTTAGVLSIASVPEPGTLALFGAALAGMGFALRRRAKKG